jgi:hypothetical protein
LLLLPCDDGVAILSRATEILEASVENACLNQARFDPEPGAALLALEAVTTIHFFQRGPKVLAGSAVNQAVESGDSGRPPDEELNAAGVARNVRFGLFRDPDLAKVHADRAREHALCILDSHRSRPPDLLKTDFADLEASS